MQKKMPKSTVVAFKVEDELATFLNNLPNKSDYIRKAIYAHLGISCPLCHGTGSVSKETHDSFTKFLEKWELHKCQGCGDEFALPKEADDAIGPLKEQLERLKEAGEEFCVSCMSRDLLDHHPHGGHDHTHDDVDDLEDVETAR